MQITPISLQNIGYKTYIIFAVLNACWVPVIWIFYPETKGLELEDVDRLFARDEIVRIGLAGGVVGGVGVEDGSMEKFEGGRVESHGKVGSEV